MSLEVGWNRLWPRIDASPNWGCDWGAPPFTRLRFYDFNDPENGSTGHYRDNVAGIYTAAHAYISWAGADPGIITDLRAGKLVQALLVLVARAG